MSQSFLNVFGKKMQLRHVGVVCKDLQNSLDFYVHWFGCSVARDMNESGEFISAVLAHENIDVRTVKLNFPGGSSQLELLEFSNPKMGESHTSLFTQGITHFALQVRGLDRLFQDMSLAGIHFLSSPMLSEDGLAKVCFCKTPEGVFIELVELINQ